MTETAKKAPRLHELLAAMGDSEKRAKLVQAEARETFVKRSAHFRGSIKTLSLLEDSDEARAVEAGAAEQSAVTSTVLAKLAYIKKPVANWWNTMLQKEATNQEAQADLVIGGKTIAENLPAGFLLGMERELKELRNVVEAIPTHEPGKNWVSDESVVAQDGSKGILRNAVATVRPKEKKVLKGVTLHEGNEHHAPNVQAVNDVVTLGTFTVEEYSAMVTPAEKSQMLARVSELLKAVKRARMRANQTPVVKKAVGNALFRYILEGGDIADEDDEG